MADAQYQSLPAATHSKLQNYRELLNSASRENNIPFWDIVVLTSIDDDQKSCYEQQIQLKKERKEIPESVRYLVFSDPPGAKIGNGGATMHAFEQMEKVVGWEELKKARVLLLHAGGYSQRLPSVSVVGKIFMGLPCGTPMFQMLDAMLVMYIDLPARMNPGVFLASSDIFLLYNGAGEWDMKQPGITALAHPLDTKVATRHGVFVFDDVEEIRRRYRDDPTSPSSMSKVNMFLHKVSIEKMKANHAVIPETNQVYADLAYYLDFPTVRKLIKFYCEHKPIKCEIDAYGDFLQALGSAATSEYCSNVANVTMVEDGLVEMREKVFQLMQGTQFTAVVLNEAMFNHMGTTQEYLHHFCRNKVLLNSYQLEIEKMVRDVDRQEDNSELTEPEAKRHKGSNFESCIVMHSVLHDRSSISIGKDSVVEYCIIGEGAKIGRNCIVSNLHIPANAQIPNGSYIHSIPLQVDGTTQFATFAFDISDSMKTSISVEEQSKLIYCSMNIDEAMKLLHGDDTVASLPLWPSEVNVCSLWTARLFPVFATRMDSSKYAIAMLNCLKAGIQPDKYDIIASGKPVKRMSVTEMVKSKSIASLLQFHNELRTMILQQ